MPIEEGFFETWDGKRLFYRFQAGDPDKNLILLVHGHGEHSGRYEKFFKQLGDLSSPIGIADLRGCGESAGPAVYVSHFEDYLKDLSSFRAFLKTRYKLRKGVRLFGHSLGGLIATSWALQNKENVSKLILSSPLFGMHRARSVKFLVTLLHPLVPRFVIQNPVDVPLLTHDPEEVEKYRRDPLIRRRITVRLVHEMLRYIELVSKGDLEFPFPVYVLMSDEDAIVDSEGTFRFFERLRAPEKKLETFPGFYHEIFNEKGQEQAFERLRFYLTKK